MSIGITQRTVLLVEDEALVAMAAEDNLQTLGFQVICAQTGAEALTLLEREPDLAFVVVDIGLPDMRGDELARSIRRSAPHLPIIIATGYNSGSLGDRLEEDPAVAFLGKPYSDNDLEKVITQLGIAAG